MRSDRTLVPRSLPFFLMLHGRKREGLVGDVMAETTQINDRGRIGSSTGHTTAFYLMPPTYSRVVYCWSCLACKLVLSWLARTVHLFRCLLYIDLYINANARSYLEKNILTELIKLNLELTCQDLCVKQYLLL